MADPEEGPGGPGPPLIFNTKLRPEGLTKIFWRLPAPPPPPRAILLNLVEHQCPRADQCYIRRDGY